MLSARQGEKQGWQNYTVKWRIQVGVEMGVRSEARRLGGHWSQWNEGSEAESEQCWSWPGGGDESRWGKRGRILCQLLTGFQGTSLQPLLTSTPAVVDRCFRTGDLLPFRLLSSSDSELPPKLPEPFSPVLGELMWGREARGGVREQEAGGGAVNNAPALKSLQEGGRQLF